MAKCNQLKDIAFKAIDDRSNALQELSGTIWEHPELCYEEVHAHKVLTELLEKEGFTVQRHHPLTTSFVAKYGNDKGGLTYGFVCEYDALPEIGHACGHNLIAEAGAAAALGVKEVLSRKDLEGVDGQVIVYGTPAEEGGGGKIKMIRENTFHEADICQMVHPFPSNEYAPFSLACQEKTYTFHGKASHASAAPWDGINALDALVAFYNSVSMLRQQIKPDAKVHGIVTNGGAKPNIIPEKAEMVFLIRHANVAELEVLIEKVDLCAKGAAIATGCTVDITATADPYSNLLTNATLAKLFCSNAKILGVDFPERSGVSGSTDMGNLSNIIPSIQPHYAIPTEGANHTRAFATATKLDASQKPTLDVAKAMAGAAIDVMCNPELMQNIKRDFENKICRF